ncbi:MAG: TIGR02302 family protein [Hyphomicrobiales bacterium]|nr:TIGR02302 family protein [Hyphomicrobiales bacterium]
MNDGAIDDEGLERRIARAMARARLAAWIETGWRAAITPVWIFGLVVGLLWIGLRDLLPGPAGAGVVGGLLLLGLAAVGRAVVVGRREAAAATRRPALIGRIERASGLTRRELGRLDDALAGDASAETRALWTTHRRRLAASIGRLSAGAPDPDLARRDRFALRPALALLLFVGWFAAGEDRLARLGSALSLGAGSLIADRLDVWIEPPLHTGLPAKSLIVDGAAAAAAAPIETPADSRLVVRASPGAPGRVAGAIAATATPAESLAAEAASEPPATGGVREQRFRLVGTGEASIALDGREALRLAFRTTADRAPTIAFLDTPQRRGRSGLALAYEIGDDWGVVSATARIRPTGAGRPLYEPPILPLTLPIGARHLGRAETVRDLGSHPFAGAEVAIEPVVVDGAGQEGRGEARIVRLPERPFRDPLARALVELRRRLALDAAAIPTVAIALDALTLAPERFGVRPGVHLGLRHLAALAGQAHEDDELRTLCEGLWAAAATIEAGDTLDEEKALRAARDALAEALRSGASDEEIARLTQELRRAMDRWLEALSEAARRDPGARDRAEGQARRVDRRSLQAMLDRIEKLGRTGSRDAAERLLAELGDTLDQLRGARSGSGGGGAEALGEMIRRQRRLMDRTHEAERDGADAGARERLLDDQNELRDAVRRLNRSLRQRGGTSEGEESAGEALDEAARAMDDAGRAIDRGEGETALGAQGRALRELGRGARELARGRGEGEGGSEAGESGGEEDPLGRPRRSRNADGGRVGIPETIEVERARRILEDIRRRLGDPGRGHDERDYLDRLLDLD